MYTELKEIEKVLELVKEWVTQGFKVEVVPVANGYGVKRNG